MECKAIFVSINPIATRKIELGTKNHEFRNYCPKKGISFLYVYETAPTSELKYILEIGDIIEYPNMLLIDGDGNSEFNNGEKAKYAYYIKRIYKLEQPIPLSILKRDFNFTPPQAYAYCEKYPTLTEKIITKSKRMILERE